MSSGSASTTGPGRPEVAGVKRPADVLGQALGVLDLRDPLRERSIHQPVVDLLEGLAVGHGATDLPDQQHHGRRILEADMHAGTGVRGSGAAGHHADTPARPVSLP